MPIDDYVCTLDDGTLKKAKKELNEDPKNRSGAIETLRQWLDEQPHINFTKDTRVLLQYLRYSKFSQLKARESIENFCTAVTNHPGWIDTLDPFDPLIIKLAKTKMIIPLSGHDKFGRKLCLIRFAAYSPVEWKNHIPAMSRAMFCMFFYLLHDERSQVNGFVYLWDMTGLTIAHQTFFSVETLKLMLKLFQKTVPGRFRGFHHYNCGPVWEAFMALIRPFFTKKWKERQIVEGSNLEKVYKTFPEHMMPLEYLPDDYTGPNAGSMDSIVDNMLIEMQKPEMVKYLRDVASAEWKAEMTKKPENVPQESFRKLNID